MRNTDILIVDDEIGIREVFRDILEDNGYTVALAENAEEARQFRNQVQPAMVLLDIWMPDSDGITLLKEWVKNGQLNMPVVMMSGHGSIETAIEATKIGAIDFLEKPIPLNKLLTTVERALKYSENQNNKNIELNHLGNAPAIKELYKQVDHARSQTSPILILGEAGSPFEMVALAFHKENTPWITPNRHEHITEMPTELLNKASGGILYLGDITQYNKTIQQNIGFIISKAERHNTRVICTSSSPLNELLTAPNQDTRVLGILSSLVITIPPLRDQIEDITLLVKNIIQERKKQGQPETHFTHSALAKLSQYNWPGNLEQLKNVVNSLCINAENNEVNDKDVTKILNQFNQSPPVDIQDGFNFNLPLRELRTQLERRYFEYHIQKENHNMSRVALKVGLERTHLYRKLKQLGITFIRRQEKD